MLSYEWWQKLAQEHPDGLGVLRAVLMILPILTIVPLFIWWERRLLSWMQDRIGPNRTGTITFKGKKIRTFGLLQPLADGIKLFLKEDVTPNAVDRAIYFIAPALALFPAFAIGATLPWGPTRPDHVYHFLTPVANVDIGILYVMAISSLGVYGIVLAGYASNNKYSLLGGLRSSAQLISYELAMGMSLASIVMFTGSLRMSDMVNAQEQPLWGIAPLLQNWFIFTPFGFVSFVIFMICMVAETNRAPFDLPEAENEIIAGYHTEYSSMKFAVFFMGEYAAMFMFGMIASCVFLGGYNMLPINWNVVSDMGGISAVGSFMKWMNDYLGPIWLIGKGITFITIYIWIRATLPRLRYDQLMSLGWKSLLPISVGNFIVVAIWILFVRKTNPVLAAIACCLAVVCLYVLAKPFIEMTRGKAKVFARRRIRMVSDPKPEEGGAS